MAARPAATDGARGAARGVQRVHPPRPLSQGAQRAGDAGQAELARAALAGRLLGQVAGDPRHLPHRAGPLAERQHDAGPECAARRRQPGPRDGDGVGDLTRQPFAVVAADQDPIAHLRAADVEHHAQRNPGGDLHDRRAGHRAAHGEQDRARLVGGAGRGVAVGTEHGEHGQLREGLRVGQQGGQAVHAGVAGPPLAAGGMAGLPLTALTRAPPSPDTNLSGTSTTRTRAFSSGSAMAASATDRLTSPSGPVPATPTTISFPPSARQARSAPPRTR